MKSLAKHVLRLVAPVIDAAGSLFTAASCAWLRFIRKSMRLAGMPVSRLVFEGTGVFPILNEYYEPLFVTRHLQDLERVRHLPGIDFRDIFQLELLRDLEPYGAELQRLEFDFTNSGFGAGDAEIYYSLIRHLKPERIIEIGSGYSTRVAVLGVTSNRNGKITCIEPYENLWLESLPVTVHRKRLEQMDLSLFDQLEAGDMLFIDSTHMIKPRGDVVVEYLELLPRLKPGVFVHVHDIFTPWDYPREWIVSQNRFWNEQYLLEAFLSFNSDFQVLLALNYLKQRHSDKLALSCPQFAKNPSGVHPGSFWMKRI